MTSYHPNQLEEYLGSALKEYIAEDMYVGSDTGTEAIPPDAYLRGELQLGSSIRPDDFPPDIERVQWDAISADDGFSYGASGPHLDRRPTESGRHLADIQFEPRGPLDEYETRQSFDDTVFAAWQLAVKTHERTEEFKGEKLLKEMREYTDLVSHRCPEGDREAAFLAELDRLEDTLHMTRRENTS